MVVTRQTIQHLEPSGAVAAVTTREKQAIAIAKNPKFKPGHR